MTDTSDNDVANPFEDPTGPSAEPAGQEQLDVSDVLTVDRNATLTLGTEALIVLDEGLRHRRAAANCCGLLPQLSKTTKAIPFYNILWAGLSEYEVTISYAQNTGKKSCRVRHINYNVIDKIEHAKRWVDRLMERAYPVNTKRKKRIKVLVNPFGGQGYAPTIWTREVEPVFATARCEIEVEKTAYRGHAVEIAEKMDIDAFDVVACASGDGLPHEVFNGLAKRTDGRRALRKIAVVQIPCGTGNAMSLNLTGTDSPSLAAVAIVKGIRTPMDLVAVTQGANTIYSFLSQAVGIIADLDLGTESLRWMGPLRFTWGALVRLLGKTIYPAEIAVAVESDDKNAIKKEYRRVVDEHEAVRSKQLHEQEDEETELNHMESGETQIPALKFGTVRDPLPKNFQTQDLPTLGNFYVGNMCWMSSDLPFFATALPADGKMDMVNIDGTLSRVKGLTMLTSCADGSIINFPDVSYRKVSAYRITPRVHIPKASRLPRVQLGRWLGGAGKQKEGLIAVDGERIPFEPYQAEVVPGLGTVLSKRGAVYEFDGPPEIS